MLRLYSLQQFNLHELSPLRLTTIPGFSMGKEMLREIRKRA